MPSPIKASVSSHAAVIDGYIKECPLDPGLQSVMDDRCLDLLAVKARAVQAVAADRMRPKYDRLGMKRLAWLFHVSERTMYEWWAAYQEGGADALRRHTENLGQKPKVGREALEEARDRLLARSAQAEAARNIEDAKEDRDARKAEGAGAAARGGGGKEEGAEDAGAAGAAGNAECIASLIAAGLAPAGERRAGRDGAPRPGSRGRRQRRLPPRSLTPEEFGAEVRKATGVEYSRSHLYDLLASLDASPKTATAIPANRA